MFAGFADDSAIFRIHGTDCASFRRREPARSHRGLDAMSARANFLIGNDPAAWRTVFPLIGA